MPDQPASSKMIRSQRSSSAGASEKSSRPARTSFIRRATSNGGCPCTWSCSKFRAASPRLGPTLQNICNMPRFNRMGLMRLVRLSTIQSLRRLFLSGFYFGKKPSRRSNNGIVRPWTTMERMNAKVTARDFIAQRQCGGHGEGQSKRKSSA